MYDNWDSDLPDVSAVDLDEQVVLAQCIALQHPTPSFCSYTQSYLVSFAKNGPSFCIVQKRDINLYLLAVKEDVPHIEQSKSSSSPSIAPNTAICRHIYTCVLLNVKI